MYARTLYIRALVSSCVCIHILTHLYAYSLMQLLTYAVTRLLSYSLTQLLTYSVTHLCSYSLIQLHVSK